MSGPGYQVAPAQVLSPPMPAVDSGLSGAGGGGAQDSLGNAEVQARLSQRGLPAGIPSGAEGGPGHQEATGLAAFSPAVQAALAKTPPEAQAELVAVFPRYAAHVQGRLAEGWSQGNLGNLGIAASKRSEWSMDPLDLGGVKIPWPTLKTREDPLPDDPKGICYDWQADIAGFFRGQKLAHWLPMRFSREGVDHHAGGVHYAKDPSIAIVFDAWADQVSPGQVQTEAEWLAD